VFQCTNGVVFGPYAAKNYEPNFGPRADGFRGFTIGVNLATPEEMNAVHVRLAPRIPRLHLPRSRGQPVGRRLEARLDRDGRGRPDLVTRRPL
jgi:hypothetical protein